MENLSGQIIKGYELGERLGAGGFGAVYKAHQSTVGREVAIKIILPGLANHPEFIRRFETEAQLIARLEHPYITPLYDYWRDPDGAYLVMRWLRGGSLQQALQNGTFDIASSLLLMEQITAALATAHRNQIIHRDLKPANILLDEDGNAYLADFGIAKDLTEIRKAVTQPDAIIGSPDYLAPEQARSESVTPQTDIYSLGVILYEVLVGAHPFPNLSAVERLYKHLNDPLPAIENLPVNLANLINEVIQKATAKNASQRYSDVLAFMVAFRNAVAVNTPKMPENLVETLTRREQEILQLIVDGLSNKEISQELFLTLATVKWYVTQIYSKLHVRSRVQASVRARELNLIVSGDSSDESSLTVEMLTSDAAQFHVENPYKGLLAFQSSDHLDFFGREKLIQKLIKRLETADDSHRFLAIVGPSGSGKSSLLKAGLIPALWRGAIAGSEKWYLVELVPGAHPLEELEVALIRVAANQAGNLHDQLARDERGLLRAANLILPNDDSELVVVIDQFEEVFTMLVDEAARIHFLQLLVNAVTDPRSRVRVIMTLRADFYDRPLHYPEFGNLIRNRMETVLPLSAEELERAISKPAERVGIHFEEGLVASIVSEINYQPGALPLLQYALTELFEQRQGRTLTHEAYQSIGRAVGALAKRAEELYAGLGDTGKETARQMFTRLVTVGDGKEATRRRVQHSELLSLAPDSESMEEVIDTFAVYRLLTLDHDAGTRSPTVEVAHEAILREWQRLSNWINDYREDIKMREQLDHIAQQWDEKGKEVSYLVSGQRLTQLEGWAGEKRQALTAMERAYLEASLAERTQQAETETKRQQREQKLERRSLTFLRGLLVVMALALLGAIGLTGIATNESKQAVAARFQAEDQARIATSRELVGYANASLNTDAELSTLLAMQAIKTTYDADKTVLPEANTVLHQAVAQLNSPLKLSFHEDGKFLGGPFLFSPDGSRIATMSTGDNHIAGNETKISDASTGKVLYTMRGLLLSMTWPVSNQLITDDQLQDSQEIIQWDVSSSENVKQLSSIKIPVSSVTNGENTVEWFDVTLDHQLLLLMNHFGYGSTIWDLKTGQSQHTLNLYDGFNILPWFSPDGSRLVYRNPDATMSVVSTTDWKEIFRLKLPDGPPDNSSDYFTHDGQTILVASGSRVLTIWDAATGQLQQTITPPDSSGVYLFAMSPDKTRVATLGKDGTITLWDTASGKSLISFVASPDLGWLDFTPDGQRLAGLVGDDILIWNIQDLAHGREFLTLVNNDSVESLKGKAVAYSPDGQRLVEANYNDTPTVWDAQTGQKVFTLSGHKGVVFGAAWSPDGKWIVTTGDDHNAILWDAATGKEIRTLSGHTAAIYGAAFSPDSKLIATASDDGSVRVWDITNGHVTSTLDFNGDHTRGIAWSPDGKRIAATSTSNGTTRIWNVMTGEKLLEVSVSHNDLVYSVAFSPDGSHIVTSSFEQKGAVVWDAQSGEKLMTLSGHINQVNDVAYSPDGTQITTASLDGSVKLWDASTGEERLTLFGAPQGVNRVAFSPNGKHLATQNFDNTTRIYVLDIDELLTLAQSRLTRWWTADECKKYLHTDTCPVR